MSNETFLSHPAFSSRMETQAGFPLLDTLVQSTTAQDYITSDHDLDPAVPAHLNPAEFDHVVYLPDLSYVTETWTEDGAFIPTTLAYSLAFVFGILGNSLVVFALLGDRKYRSVTSSFLVSLAVSDIVFLLVCVPYEVMAKLSTEWVGGREGGRALCKLAGFVEMLTAAASVLNLTAVSMERYAVIVHPIRSRSWCSFGRTYRIILLVWLSATFISSPPLIIMDTTRFLYYNNTTHVILVTCGDSVRYDVRAFVWYQLIVMFLLPVLVIIYCYSFVIVALWASTRRLARLTQTPSSSHGESVHRFRSSSVMMSQHGVTCRQLSSETSDRSCDVRETRKQVIRMLLTIIAIFFCCWGPKWVLNVMKRHQFSILHTDPAFYIMLIIHILPYIQSAINPIIYGFMSNNFRRSLRGAVGRLRMRCRHYSCSKLIGRESRRHEDHVLMTSFYDAEGILGYGMDGMGNGRIYEDGRGRRVSRQNSSLMTNNTRQSQLSNNRSNGLEVGFADVGHRSSISDGAITNNGRLIHNEHRGRGHDGKYKVFFTTKAMRNGRTNNNGREKRATTVFVT